MKITKKGYYRFLVDRSIEGMEFPNRCSMHKYSKGAVVKVIGVVLASDPSLYSIINIADFGWTQNCLPVEVVSVFPEKKEPEKVVEKWRLVGTHRIELVTDFLCGGFGTSLYVDEGKIGYFLSSGKLLIHPSVKHRFKVLDNNGSLNTFKATFFVYEYV